MNNQPCNEVATWTCRQPALSQEQPMLMTRAQASSAVVPAGTVHDGALVQSFVPGVVAHYLTHQDFPITRELAVVFVDLVNSTRVLSQQPPAQALTLIQHFTELVTEIAVAHCGDVKDYEGDGALLYFASIVNATRAALAIRTALEALHTPDGQVVQARFSLNVGEVTIGVIGSATRRSVALIGPTVHLAARLLKHVTPGGIIAPQTVIDRLQQEAPTVAQDFRLLGKCLTIRDFEEQCVTAYSLPANSPESQLVEGYRPKAEGPPLFSLYSLKPQASSLSPTPDPQCLFRCEGDYWTLSFAGVVCRLKDTRGLHYLAHLLQHPHQEFHAITLVSAQVTPDDEAASVSRVHSSSLSHDHTGVFSDAGAMLDPQACAAYKQRVTELRADLDEARRFNDLGRVEKLQTELHFLTQELAHDIGLGGRARKAASVAERARISVTKAIKIALRRINESHPELGHHLAVTIKTGTYCSYAPDARVPIRWQS